VKVGEFSGFLSYAVKYGNQEVTAIGTGSYFKQNQIVKVNGIYPILDASGGGASVTITASGHNRLHRTLRHWNEDDEVAILHSHPHFSSFKSQTDDQHAIRMACLLFGGVAVMIIVDPFSHGGVDVSAYAIQPDSKVARMIPFQLVP
jgi:proteasome lid subunit RPN8/RPN11